MANKDSSNGTNNGVAKRRTRTPKSKFERLLILAVATMAIIVVFVNISLLTTSIQESDDHHSVKNTHLETIGRNFSAAAADQGRVDKGEAYTVDEKLMRILRHVGIENESQLSEDDRRLLPTWEEVVDRVGNDGPKILGLETCKAYRAQVTESKRVLAVAGPFNSGTHFLNEVMSENCKLIKPGIIKQKNPGVLHQVPWGKHQSPRFRLVHNTDLGRSIDKGNDALKEKNNGEMEHPELPPDLLEFNKNVLPVVMVRDPFTWWQSMCKSRYSAHWYHIVPLKDGSGKALLENSHCPNFIANDVEKEWFYKKKLEVRKYYDGDPWKIDNVIEKANYTLDKKVVPLWVRYHSENRKHKSLAHMWTDWYKDYYDAEFPRLMIRLEDLVFYPHETLRQVCECVGSGTHDDEDGYFEYIGDENLILSLDSSIKGSGKGVDNIHGKDRTGLLGAMAKHAGPHSVSHRATGMTKEDLEFASNVLKDSETMSYFGYKVPHESHLELSRIKTAS